MPLKVAADIFQPTFLDRLVDDRPTDRSLGGRQPRQIVHGPEAPLFHDVQAMIALAVTCFNFLGDGLRDALDPRGEHR